VNDKMQQRSLLTGAARNLCNNQPLGLDFSTIAALFTAREKLSASICYFGYHSSSRTSIPVPSNPF
jgi:hypothetical protein